MALIRSSMTDLDIDEPIQNAICNKLNEYLNNSRGKRTGILSFFAPYCLRNDYWKFTKNIGGEICDFGLSDSFPDVYDKLTI